MKHILALHTGGTISMTQNEAGNIEPSAHNPLLQTDQPFNDEISVTAEDFSNLPSPHMTPKVMLKLHDRILKAEAEGIDGVVVTHGTDTLEETAYFLDLTLPNTIPVVLTGAMRSANEIGSDGLYNFQSAIRAAASDEAYGMGVLVVMNDEVHTARYVTKTQTTNVATFRTPTFGPIGLISKGKVRFFQKLLHQEVCPIDHVVDHVFLLKAYAGMDGEQFELLDRPDTNGLVIEALGAGNLPPATLPAIQKMLDRHIPIVLVSRCPNGIAQDIYDYEGGGVELKKMGITFCQGLNGQKARIKLLVGLSGGKQGDELKHFLDNAVS
ncbi:L-asparaginase [Lactobacillus selangorensis]|uniref:L-asparaginase n=1 Tax=Lactobacillus selangorensis TaxID=81857 RepID=A0A0R2FSK3_9LACO|nr:asparaginase [Lactobacillus selangorensis]KRN27426.1 L-asparaginase [Lactobacillus selangorensis]KRN31377.1 L-asparaginase [Lactobacillus selangorensis]